MPSNLSRRLNNNSSHRRNSSSPRNRCLAEAITATRWSIRTLKGRRYQQRSSLALPFALTVDKCIQVTRPILSLMHHPCNSDSHADPKRCVSILEINGMFQWLTASRQPKKIQLVSHVSSVIACHFFVFHRRIWKQPMPLSRKIQLMSRREEIYLVEWEAWPPPLVPEETKVVRLSHAFQDDWNSGFVYIFHFLLSIFLFFLNSSGSCTQPWTQALFFSQHQGSNESFQKPLQIRRPRSGPWRFAQSRWRPVCICR